MLIMPHYYLACFFGLEDLTDFLLFRMILSNSVILSSKAI